MPPRKKPLPEHSVAGRAGDTVTLRTLAGGKCSLALKSGNGGFAGVRTYHFAWSDFDEMLEQLEAVTTRYPGVWREVADRDGDQLLCRVEDGRFICGPSLYHQVSVAWSRFFKAVSAVAGEQAKK